MYNGQETQQGYSANSMMFFILGAAVGATVMLLCAPASGSEVRSRIAERATDFKDKAGEWTGQAADKAAEWKDKAMTAAHDTLDRAAETFTNTDGAFATGQTKESARV
jgi:gas vesicle protein